MAFPENAIALIGKEITVTGKNSIERKQIMKTVNENKALESRLKIILRTSIIGIIVNVFLGVFKAIIGTISNSIAITLDAVNNFTDAGSSMVTILSTSFSSKAPDKKHPFGYGRIEYLGTLLISVLILYAGITSFVESIKGILHHEVAEYSTVSIIIIVVAVVVKTALALFFSSVGKKVKSDSLVATGKEAVGDIAISISTVVAAIIFVVSGLSIEAWLGVIIALFIVKTGAELIFETVAKILGTGAEATLVTDIKKAIVEFDQVAGAYDLVLHNYGPDAYLGSVHIEVEDTLEVSEIDALSRHIQEVIAERFSVFISAVGVYFINTKDEKVVAIREDVRSMVLAIQHVKQLHGFYLDDKSMRFDVVVSFEAGDRMKVYQEVMEKVQGKYPEYALNVGMDMDYNEI